MALPGPYDRPNAELSLKPANEMRRLFEGLPRACDATLEIAAKCQLELPLGQFHFPAADIPQAETPYSVLAKESWRGLERRYQPMTPEAISRLQHELSLIDSMGFSEYFLVVKEIVDYAKSRGIRCSGRGSAGDSIVSYALGITDADPDPLRPAVRAVLEPCAPPDARHRRRFRLGPPRRDHRLHLQAGSATNTSRWWQR